MKIVDRKDISNILDDIVSALGSVDYIEALSLVGSFSRGFGDQYSDIDITGYCSRIPSVACRRRKLKSLNPDSLSSEDNRDTFLYRSWKVDINYLILEELEKEITGNKELSPDAVSYVLRAQILCENGDILTKLKEKAISKNNIDFTQNIGNFLTQLYGEIEKMNVASLRKDVIYLSNRLERSKEKLVRVIYKLNEYPFVSLKWSYKDMQSFKILPKDFIQKLEEFSLLSIDRYAEKVFIMNNLLDETANLTKDIFGIQCNSIIGKRFKVV